MKLVHIVFTLIITTVLFSCSSKDAEEESVVENLVVTSVSGFSGNEETQSVSVISNLDWSVSSDSNWITTTPSSGTNSGAIAISVETNPTYNDRSGTVTVSGGTMSRDVAITQAAAEETNGTLDPNKTPSENFDLSTWNLSIPEDQGNGTATTISVSQINNNYENSSYFYTAADGGMVFKCPVDGYKTSENTSYTRVELREMLRGTNTSISTQGVNGNNWVFGTAPIADINAAAGYDGEMNATLAVNHVTTTGSNSHVGRVIIGQIHANDDEPIRIYYRKLQNNALGSIYFAHEPTDGNGAEQWYEMIGSRSNSASNPADGIALNEVFSYRIKVVGDDLTVTIIREGKPDVVETVNMVNSGFNVGGQYMYFKAGVYQGNNSGDDDDYVQATFYALEKTHTTN
ncbi:polysaccharide lyase family 7 protein [Winogradskyella thalassocola]|uniref:Putative binding domain-containing protein, N-terminal n=1 Tax=Winogradskyella thalassocola TaxID=262004 RepID=A0A1G8K0M5_9FLAO|nr:polysaccharide lyase family 7 protein [Winogradskyella thalassocola]SDI37026.1 Putative binding domain-containing protein, N-terminal [Winogradskyella thalassocola]